ncbi:hypothetical protein NC651_034511 [Populus alba x Populus x berolinensis]|nr:hypothetical protein NC651_034511 [Populus alba x Populus x berolinensis]
MLLGLRLKRHHILHRWVEKTRPKGKALMKEVKKVVHLVLHAIAIILGCVGISAAFKNHNESNIANLYSLHSWLGITIISLYGIQWIYGFLVFFYPKGSPTLRSECLPWHVLFGIFVYILAVGNAALGFLEKLTFLESSGIAKYGPEALLVNFTAVVTALEVDEVGDPGDFRVSLKIPLQLTRGPSFLVYSNSKCPNRKSSARLPSGVTDSEMGESPSRKAIGRTSRRSVPTKAALTQSQEVLLSLWIAKNEDKKVNPPDL